MQTTMKPLAIVLAAAVALAGCKREQPAPPATPPPPAAPSISGLMLGSAVGADKRVPAPKDAFGVRDTIYVSVATDGTGSNTKVKAVWTFGTETVRADSLMLNLAGPAVTEFHISRPRAWPAGAYQVAVSLNDAAAQTRDFVVR